MKFVCVFFVIIYTWCVNAEDLITTTDNPSEGIPPIYIYIYSHHPSIVLCFVLISCILISGIFAKTAFIF